MSADWSMIIRLEEGYCLNKDECSFDISDDSVELILVKRDDCIGLWDRFYIGVSEINLKVSFFLFIYLFIYLIISLSL